MEPTLSAQTLVRELIRERREERGLTQAELADDLGVSRKSVSVWENGHFDTRGITALNRKRLARELGGLPADYELSKADYDDRDRRERAKRDIEAYGRRRLGE